VGAGDTTLDLAGGEWPDRLNVTVRDGVGRATVYLPSDMGVRADVTGGIGQVNTTGLTREGDAYVNEACDGVEALLSLDIEGGVGEINLEVIE
jgi:predicted membrane protein